MDEVNEDRIRLYAQLMTQLDECEEVEPTRRERVVEWLKIVAIATMSTVLISLAVVGALTIWLETLLN